MTHTHFVRAGE